MEFDGILLSGVMLCLTVFVFLFCFVLFFLEACAIK